MFKVNTFYDNLSFLMLPDKNKVNFSSYAADDEIMGIRSNDEVIDNLYPLLVVVPNIPVIKHILDTVFRKLIAENNHKLKLQA